MITVRTAHGFSLIELACILVIFGILAGGLSQHIILSYQYRNTQQMDADLASIKQALVVYAKLYGRLPCPDIDRDGYGDSQFDIINGTTCTLHTVGEKHQEADYHQQRRVAVGWLPYKELSSRARNRFGFAYQYIITLHYADFDINTRDPTAFPFHVKTNLARSPRCENAHYSSSQDMRPSFTVCSRGGVKVKRIAHTGRSSVVDEHAVLAVIDLNKGGWHPSSNDEKINIKFNGVRNLNTNAVARYHYYRNRTVIADSFRDAQFDHRVMWLSHGELMSTLIHSMRHTGVQPW